MPLRSMEARRRIEAGSEDNHSGSTLLPAPDGPSGAAAYAAAGSGAMTVVRPSSSSAVMPIRRRVSMSTSTNASPRHERHVSFAPDAVFSPPSACTSFARRLLRCVRNCCRSSSTVKYVNDAGEVVEDDECGGEYGYGSEDSFYSYDNDPKEREHVSDVHRLLRRELCGVKLRHWIYLSLFVLLGAGLSLYLWLWFATAATNDMQLRFLAQLHGPHHADRNGHPHRHAICGRAVRRGVGHVGFARRGAAQLDDGAAARAGGPHAVRATQLVQQRGHPGLVRQTRKRGRLRLGRSRRRSDPRRVGATRARNAHWQLDPRIQRLDPSRARRWLILTCPSW